MRNLLAPVALVAVVVTLAPAAHAGDCGFAPAGWNAPKGALVFSRTPGPVADLFAVAGETRTHVMISMGTGSSATAIQADRKAPQDTGWPGCSLDADDLELGGPGATETNMGGVFADLFGGDHSAQTVRFMRGKLRVLSGPIPLIVDLGAKVANTMDAQPRFASYSSFNPLTGQVVQISRFLNPDISFSIGGQTITLPIYYKFSQFSNIDGVHTGDLSGGGVACSTWIAYGENQAGEATVRTKTYSHAQTRAGLFAIVDSVQSECEADTGWGVDVACFTNVCADAANQVANCMLGQNCDDDSDDTWKAFANTSSFRARTISPDNLAGAITVGTPESPLTANSVWAGNSETDVQFNSGGGVFGCWN